MKIKYILTFETKKEKKETKRKELTVCFPQIYFRFWGWGVILLEFCVYLKKKKYKEKKKEETYKNFKKKKN